MLVLLSIDTGPKESPTTGRGRERTVLRHGPTERLWRPGMMTAVPLSFSAYVRSPVAEPSFTLCPLPPAPAHGLLLTKLTGLSPIYTVAQSSPHISFSFI